MTLNLPALFVLIGILAATTVVSGLVFMYCMLWGFSSDWGPRLAVPATALTAVVSGCLFWRLAQ